MYFKIWFNQTSLLQRETKNLMPEKAILFYFSFVKHHFNLCCSACINLVFMFQKNWKHCWFFCLFVYLLNAGCRLLFSLMVHKMFVFFLFICERHSCSACFYLLHPSVRVFASVLPLGNVSDSRRCVFPQETWDSGAYQ